MVTVRRAAYGLSFRSTENASLTARPPAATHAGTNSSPHPICSPRPKLQPLDHTAIWPSVFFSVPTKIVGRRGRVITHRTLHTRPLQERVQARTLEATHCELGIVCVDNDVSLKASSGSVDGCKGQHLARRVGSQRRGQSKPHAVATEDVYCFVDGHSLPAVDEGLCESMKRVRVHDAFPSWQR